MSTEDQDKAIAQLVRERYEAKKQRSLLEAQLVSAGRVLRELAGMEMLGSPLSDAGKLLDLIEKHSDLLMPSKLGRMMKEYVELGHRLRDMNARARDAGID